MIFLYNFSTMQLVFVKFFTKIKIVVCNHSKHEVLPIAGLMLYHRLRRWPNIRPEMGKLASHYIIQHEA